MSVSPQADPSSHTSNVSVAFEKDNNSCTTQESTVFNNPQDSDIVLEYNGKRVYAHRAIIRMSSPFFERILQSQWPVARSPVFSLGDDDDPEIIDAMLRHMYNLPYLSPSVNRGDNLFKFHVDVFMLADKYDCPSLRCAAASNFRRIADGFIADWQHRREFVTLITAIADLCGPDARESADLSLRREALKFCSVNYGRLFTYLDFQERVQDGSLFDVEAMTELLTSLGALAMEKQGLSSAGMRRTSCRRYKRMLRSEALFDEADSEGHWPIR